jgi:hypothetical protein
MGGWGGYVFHQSCLGGGGCSATPTAAASAACLCCPAAAAGTEKGMVETFGSTCHGAGRSCSRNAARKGLDYEQVLGALKTRGIAIRVARCARAVLCCAVLCYASFALRMLLVVCAFVRAT